MNSQPYYASKKIVIQSLDFPVRRTGSYRHKKSTGCDRCVFEPAGKSTSCQWAPKQLSDKRGNQVDDLFQHERR